MRGQVREWWGKITDDDLDQINGKRDQMIGKLQERYGYTRERAEREVNDHWVTKDPTGGRMS
jgi:uncharacterized protein YjbJ (UPF0337 family)